MSGHGYDFLEFKEQVDSAFNELATHHGIPNKVNFYLNGEELKDLKVIEIEHDRLPGCSCCVGLNIILEKE